jgi:hypothetical protein
MDMDGHNAGAGVHGAAASVLVDALIRLPHDFRLLCQASIRLSCHHGSKTPKHHHVRSIRPIPSARGNRPPVPRPESDAEPRGKLECGTDARRACHPTPSRYRRTARGPADVGLGPALHQGPEGSAAPNQRPRRDRRRGGRRHFRRGSISVRSGRDRSRLHTGHAEAIPRGTAG